MNTNAVTTLASSTIAAVHANLVEALNNLRADTPTCGRTVADMQPEDVVAQLANRTDLTDLEAALVGHLMNLMEDAKLDAQDAAQEARPAYAFDCAC